MSLSQQTLDTFDQGLSSDSIPQWRSESHSFTEGNKGCGGGKGRGQKKKTWHYISIWMYVDIAFSAAYHFSKFFQQSCSSTSPTTTFERNPPRKMKGRKMKGRHNKELKLQLSNPSWLDNIDKLCNLSAHEFVALPEFVVHGRSIQWNEVCPWGHDGASIASTKWSLYQICD